LADHVTVGTYRILESPVIYELVQKLGGARVARERLINQFVRPFPGARILDAGCGPGTIIESLPENVEYVGYDLNPKYIDSAREKYGERGRFFCSRIREATDPLMEGGFDFVLAMHVLHHLHDDEAQELLEGAYHHLRDKGVLVTIDCVYVPNQSPIAKFIISKDRGKQVRDPEGYVALMKKPFSNVEKTLVTDMLRYPFTHFIMRATK
jgi:2-polyprenyl-3-methyl-5-hydroxy-6-metoxy-1,4-benzoquinol methylase